jgi:hypothetical protein
MSRKIKYDIDDILEVHRLVNKQGLTKNEAMKEAGFSDSSVYYNVLKRIGMKETLGLEEIEPAEPEISFI